MIERLFTYKNKDVTMNVCLSILEITREIARRRGISFEEAILLFSKSKTCKVLHDSENGLWSESIVYIVDKFEMDE